MRLGSVVAAATGAAALLLLGSGARAQVTYTLYDAAMGGRPGDQPWLRQGNTGGTETGPSAGSPFTNLNTTASNTLQNGYSNYNLSLAPTLVNPAFPSLNRATGVTLTFTMRQADATGTLDPARPRAGFSVILLDNDRRGVEIGFQGDTLFTQAPGFLQPAAVTSGANITALTSALTTYTLTFTGDNYALTSGGTTLLNGTVQDYTGTPGLAGIVYNTPRYLFLGDNTTGAGASTDLSFVSVTVAAPEPGTLALVASGALGVLGLAVLRRRFAP